MDFAKNKYVSQQEYDKLDLLRLMQKLKRKLKNYSEIKRVLFPHVYRINIPQSYISDLFLSSGFLLNLNFRRKP